GDGKDVIMELTSATTDTTTNYGTDKIRFGTGITQANSLLFKAGNDLIIKFKDAAGNISTTDQIIINNQFAPNTNIYRIESLEFTNDSTSLDISNPANYSFTDIGVGGTEGDDIINLTSAFNGLVETFGGNDNINANFAADFNINSGSGNDSITTGSGNDTIQASDGNDYINSQSGNDTIDGGLGNDNIYAGSGNDTILGGSGNDNIYAEQGDDIIRGGLGDDNISGNNPNSGNDLYLYSQGDGNDTIFEGYTYESSNNTDTIRFDSTINKNNIIFVRENNDLIIKFKDSAGNISSTDSIRISQQLSEQNYHGLRIEKLEFTDTSGNIITADSLNISDPNNLPLELNNFGTSSNEGIYGSVFADTITGKAGDDTLVGNLGNDTYVYNLGDGKDVIMELTSATTDTTTNYGTDKIRFGTGI
ncbi:hypothetical protein EBR66_08735, partial [bacterium]|nr:hypothetical protein [bacterium]